MAKKDPRIDAYIAKSADFARPILKHIRKLVHAACPGVEETMKWNFPHFVHKGNLCGVAAFKAHCAVVFWKRALIFGKKTPVAGEKALGQFGRITSLADLPRDNILLGYIKKAVELNEAGTRVPARLTPRKKLVVPTYFMTALKGNKKALAVFENFPCSHKREYVEWVKDAKREETRQRRLQTAVQWMSQGKSQNWKYTNC